MTENEGREHMEVLIYVLYGRHKNSGHPLLLLIDFKVRLKGVLINQR